MAGGQALYSLRQSFFHTFSSGLGWFYTHQYKTHSVGWFISLYLTHLTLSAPSDLLIRQAHIVLPSGDLLKGDVYVRAGKIVQVAPTLPPALEETVLIDAEGLTLLPGAIDPQVHFREPGLVFRQENFDGSKTLKI